ncbi:MAG: hypothetical protein ACJASV_000896 [Pseudorhodobacter sp.]|jgi:hypothetical protein
MKVFVLLAAAAATFSPLIAHAEITGGQLTLSHSAFTDDTDLSKTSLEGSMEFGFNRDVSIQGDLSFSQFNTSDLDITNIAAHGIYHLNETTSLGLFLARDEVSDGSADFVGLEAGHEAGALDLEGYLAIGDNEGTDGTIIGISGRHAMSDTVGFGASLDHGNFDNVLEVTRYSIDADYSFTPTTSLSAELGYTNFSVSTLGSATEPYVKLGATIKFGAKRGSTFGKRSITNLLPGL